jgi:hypothetical protein
MWEEERIFIVLKCAELREVGLEQDGIRAAYPITHGHNYCGLGDEAAIVSLR